jgi:hypothetical protein
LITSKKLEIRAAVFVLSLFSAWAFADPMVVLDHVAHTGPKHDALVQCVSAVRRDPAIGQQVMFSTRMGVSQPSAAGTRTFILKGTAWQNGERVPVNARCVTGPGQTVASVTLIDNGSEVASVAH